MVIVIVIAILWALGMLFMFVAQYTAVKKADRDWHINAATFRRLRKKINSNNGR